MVLEHLLAQKRSAILDRWFELILGTYPADTARFLREEKDRFANPVGYSLRCEIGTIYDWLSQGIGGDKLADSLGNVIRIRSVQDFSPSQAIAFAFLLKRAVREELKEPLAEDWLQLESRIDELALRAFDIYMECREKIADIRINELKAEREQALRLLHRAGIAGAS